MRNDVHAKRAKPVMYINYGRSQTKVPINVGEARNE